MMGARYAHRNPEAVASGRTGRVPVAPLVARGPCRLAALNSNRANSRARLASVSFESASTAIRSVGRGYGRFLRRSAAARRSDPLQVRVDAHTRRADIDALLADAPPGRVEIAILDTAESQAAAASASGSRSPLDLWRMGRAVARVPLDVLWFPSVYSWFPVPGRVPQVVGFHDTIAERHASIVFPTLRTRTLWRLKSWLARRGAAAVLTLSEFSRRCLHELLGVPLARIHVTVLRPPQPSPVADAARRSAGSRRTISRRTVLRIYGGPNPHKACLRHAGWRVPRRRADARCACCCGVRRRVFHADVAALREYIAGAASRSCCRDSCPTATASPLRGRHRLTRPLEEV